MNSKERVSIALKRQGLPDRVPMQFDLSRSLLKSSPKNTGFRLTSRLPIMRTSPIEYPERSPRGDGERLRCRGRQPAAGYTHPVDDSGCIINEFGMRMREGPIYIEVVEHPLAGVKGAEQVNDFVFPDPSPKVVTTMPPDLSRSTGKAILLS